MNPTSNDLRPVNQPATDTPVPDHPRLVRGDLNAFPFRAACWLAIIGGVSLFTGLRAGSDGDVRSSSTAIVAVAPGPAPTGPITIFSEEFDAPDSLTRWGVVPPGVTLEPAASGSVLAVARNPADGRGTVVISTALPAERLRGCRVRCEARVRADRVAQPPNPWNGIKVMLHTRSPSAGERWEQANNLFGTFDWRGSRFTTSLPDDLTEARLVLGIEESSGQAWFDEVRITVLRGPRPSGSAPVATGPAFKGHNEARLRGAMVHPDLTPESLRVLGAEWGANVLRWQFIRYVSPGGETPLDAYDAWLDSELAKLDRALPHCARHGLRVVLDLHSPPGGSRTASGYIGSDAGLFTNALAQAKFVQVWRRLAERYRENLVIWGFDLANEPVEQELGDGCDDWQSLATRAARAIRAVNTRHAIIVEPSPWGSPASIRNLDPLPVEGVVYSVHMYEPSAFTHQGIHGNVAGVRYPGLIGTVHQDKSTLRAILQPVRDFQRHYNVHVYVGEFSAIRWAPGAADYLRDCIEIFEEYDWDWTYHAFREYDGWSVEHGPDRADRDPSASPTDRQRLLLEWYGRNRVGVRGDESVGE